MVKRATNPEAAPMSELESVRRDTDEVRASVATGHTPMTIDQQVACAWLQRLEEERALPRSPWLD